MLSIIATSILLLGGDTLATEGISINVNAWLATSRFETGASVDKDDLLLHLNDLRARPQTWRTFVDSIVVLWEEGSAPRMLQHLLGSEGLSLLLELRRYLDTVQPAAPVHRLQCLDRVAGDHANDVAANPNGNAHRSSNGQTLTQRLQAQCSGIRSFGECVDHLSPTSSTVVLRLLFDPDVPGRGHRRNLFDPSYRSVGIGGAPCPNHPVLGTGYVVVLTFSDAE